MDTNRLRLCVLAGRERRSTRSVLRYLANCNFSTSGVESLADDFDVRKGPVSSRVALLLRSAEGKPYFASISSVILTLLAFSYRGLTAFAAWRRIRQGDYDSAFFFFLLSLLLLPFFSLFFFLFFFSFFFLFSPPPLSSPLAGRRPERKFSPSCTWDRTYLVI